MKKPMRWLMVALLGMFSCQKQDSSKHPDAKPGPGTSFSSTTPDPGRVIRTPAFPAPDTLTFFPLIEGSYWIYEANEEGSRESDSVISVQLTDSGYLALVLEKGEDGSELAVQYRVDSMGMVWMKRGKSLKFTVSHHLNPTLHFKVGELTYHPCTTSGPENTNCLLLQPYPGDSTGLTEEQYLGWTGKYFRKGIGIESNAGVESSMDLVEFRIGKDGLIRYPKRKSSP